MNAILGSTWDLTMIARPPPLLARGKDLVTYPKGVSSAILASSQTPFNQVSTIKKKSIWWSNIKLLISNHFSEVPIERALKQPIWRVIRKTGFRKGWQNGNSNQISSVECVTCFRIWSARRWNMDNLNLLNFTYYFFTYVYDDVFYISALYISGLGHDYQDCIL